MINTYKGIEITKRLFDAGLLPQQNLTRIVIDIKADNVIMTYYACCTDKKMLDVVIEELIKNKDRIKIIDAEGVLTEEERCL